MSSHALRLSRLVLRSPGVTLSVLVAVAAFVLVATGQPVSPTSGADPAQHHEPGPEARSGDTDTGADSGTGRPRETRRRPAQETTTTVAPEGEGQAPGQDAEQLALGSTVFSRTCTSCHQAGGVGIVGQFPPLKDNPNVTDPAYVQQVVTEGRQGTIRVKGETYNGIMPAVGAGLSDEEVAAVSAYVAANLTLPEGVEAAPVEEPTMPSPPDYSMALFALGFGLTGVVAAFVLAPLVLARTDRVHLSWTEATLKALVIVAYFVVAVVLLPARVMENDRIADLSPNVQYLIGSAVWGGGLLVGLVALWFVRRRGLV